MKGLDKPRLRVDFNEMVDSDLVLLSATDEKADSSGAVSLLVEGKEVHVFEEDPDDQGNADYLVASGTVERNLAEDWSSHVRWCCRINGDGVRHLSELSRR